MYKILFVCVGCTCRSPMASALFNQKIKTLNLSGVKSSAAGLSVDSEEINPLSKEALKSCGIKRVCIKPAQITGKDLAENNIIICMTEDNKEALQVAVSSKFVDKINCFKDFCGQDIFDPYGGDISTYSRCLKQIDMGLDKIIEVLLGNGIAKYKKSKSI